MKKTQAEMKQECNFMHKCSAFHYIYNYKFSTLMTEAAATQ